MAWILGLGLGLGTLIGGSYVVDTTSEYISDKLRPFYDYQEQSKQDAIHRELEGKRQDRHNHIKKSHSYHCELRDKYGLKESKHVKLTNDTSYPCIIVYVNHYHASNDKEAITWATNVLDTTYFTFGVLNRLNTKIITIRILEQMDIIFQEQQEYYIVLCVDGHYNVLNNTDYKKNNISIYEKMYVKQTKEHDVDLQCKWF